MTGAIDPLLGGPGRDERAPATGRAGTDPTHPVEPLGPDGAVDLTTVYEQQRPRLVRLAAVITLDHVLAEEVTQEAFVQVQRRLGAVADAPGQLVRSVVRVALDAVQQHRRGRIRRRLRIRARREFIAARRPVPVDPGGLTPEAAGAWAVIVGLSPRRRALLALRWCAGLDQDAVSEAVAWPPGMVVATEAGTARRMRRALDLHDDRRLSNRLTTTFAELEPKLVRAREDASGEQARPTALIDPTPAGTRVRVWSSIERRPSRARAVVGAVAVGALAVGAVTWYSLGSDDDRRGGAGASIDTDDAPAWYDAIAPLLPAGFEHVALVDVDGTAVTFVAIDVRRGTSLDITIARRDSTATPGAEVEVVCGVVGGSRAVDDPGPCTSGIDVPATAADGGDASATSTPIADTTPTTQVVPLDPAGVAASISAGFDLSAIQSDLGADIEASFGSPTGMRTAMGSVDGLVSKAVPDQIEVGRTSLFNGVELFLDYARAAGRQAVTSITILHGVYPPAPDLLGGTMTDHDGLLAGWILGADGRAFRVTSAAGVRADADSLAQLLVDLTGLPAESPETATTEPVAT